MDKPKVVTNRTQSGQTQKRRRRKGARHVAARVDAPYTYPLLCFDTETTNHGELLELSVFDIRGNEVYHQYFRPHAKNWPTDIHHITPEMVADCKRFSAHRHEVAKLLNSAKYLVGCALSNDLHTLHRHGIRLHENRHRIVDIQNWYWLLNDTSDRREKHQSGLAAIARHYGLNFGSEKAHSATADTRLTLESFKALAADFNNRYYVDGDTVEPILSCDADPRMAMETLNCLQKRYENAYRHALTVFRMKNLEGFINVVKREQGFSLKYTRFEPTGNENIVLSVPVTDRVKAETDLREHFEPIQVKGYTGFYRLKKKDFDYIKAYTNSIDLETYLERQRKKELPHKVTTPVERALKTLRDGNKPKKQTKSKGNPKPKGSSKTRAATQAMRIAKKAKNSSALN